MKRGDFIIMAIILLATGVVVAVLLGGGAGSRAVVTVDGEQLISLELDEEQEYRVETTDGYNIICIGGGKAWVREASCTDQLCVRRGVIDRPNQAAVCLPNKMVLRITGDDEAGIDSVAE